MVEQLEDKGVKTVLITEPFILTTSGRWDEAVEEGALALDTLGQVAVYEFFFGETGIIPWTGDVNRTWGGLLPQPEISLQMGLQGVAYMHSDLGGFAATLF